MRTKTGYFLDVRGSSLELKNSEARDAIKNGGLEVLEEWEEVSPGYGPIPTVNFKTVIVQAVNDKRS